MSHLLFHLLLVFHHSRCDTASSLFASKCLGERYALMAALCDGYQFKKGETATFQPPSNIEDGARGFKHTSNPHLGFATASLESESANIDDSPLQECRCRDSPQEL